MIAISARTLLLNNKLLAALPAASIDRIAELASRCSYPKNTLLFSQGEEGDAFFGLVSGRIRISSNTTDGQEIHLIELGPGETFGEIALIDGGPRTAAALATTDVVLFKIERRSFLRLLAERPELSFQLLLRLCERLRWTGEIVEDLSFLDIPSRLAKRVSLLATSFGTVVSSGIELRLSQAELATFLGLSRQAVNTHLQIWRQAGWLDIRRGRILIKDIEKLDQVFSNSV